MGLPIWKDPDEEKRKIAALKPDPTAPARSPIRRRPSVHGRNRNARAGLPRESTFAPARTDRVPPHVQRYNGARSPRRSANFRGVPPVSTLLESADRRPAATNTSTRAELANDYGVPVDTSSESRGQRLSRLSSALAELRAQPLRIDEFEWTPGPAAGTTAQQEREMRMAFEPHEAHRAYLSAPTQSFLTRENTPLHRSPEPMSASEHVPARSAARSGRSNLPTPPLEQSEEPGNATSLLSERRDARRPRVVRLTHPLSNSWRPESPINGLGDRDRSPTPTDGWEIMQTTITPDSSLPSADSSFTSAAASQSFGSNETALTEPDAREGRNVGQDTDSESDSVTDDGGDFMRDSEEREATARYAQDMYLSEVQSEEGLSRILRHRQAQAAEGNKFALANESEEIELGFRLIDEALDSEEGRRRVFRISQRRSSDERPFEDWMLSRRRSRRVRRALDAREEAPCPPPRMTSQDAAREANASVHDYFRRFTADALLNARARPSDVWRNSPPPEYEALPADNNIETVISQDPPEPHPVSQPSTRSQAEVGDLLSGDEQDLNAVRRVVERLAQRDDVPDEWWMSMGLNLSRTRVTSRSPVVEGHRLVDGPLDVIDNESENAAARPARNSRWNSERHTEARL